MSRKGIYKAVCQVCDFEFYNYELKKRWDGLWVDSACWEIRHPQDFIKIRPDTTKLPWTRPEPPDVEISVTYAETATCSAMSELAHANYARANCAIVGNYIGGLDAL